MEKGIARMERIQFRLWYVVRGNDYLCSHLAMNTGSIYPNGIKGNDIERNSTLHSSSNPMTNVTGNDNLLDNIQVSSL